MNRRISRTLASLAPALVLAAGMLAGTAVAAAGTPTPGSAAVGGLLLVASVLVCGELVRRRPDAPRGMRTASVILALCFSLALAIVGARDAARVSEVLPLLGAGAVVLVLDDGRRARCNRRGHELEPRT